MAAFVLITPVPSAGQPWRMPPSAVVRRPRLSKLSEPARVKRSWPWRRTTKKPSPWIERSVARPVSWPSEDGEVHGWFYPPTNPSVTADPAELPPLITISHGGPTGFSPAYLRLSVQFWTTRGIAVLDVNYGGSAGYGRAYRERLRGRWGIVDVRDCAEGAEAMGVRSLRGLGPEDLPRAEATLEPVTFRRVRHIITEMDPHLEGRFRFERRLLDNLGHRYSPSKMQSTNCKLSAGCPSGGPDEPAHCSDRPGTERTANCRRP